MINSYVLLSFRILNTKLLLKIVIIVEMYMNRTCLNVPMCVQNGVTYLVHLNISGI
jgi:hypothetical protein